jgi:histone deacetylase complex regulatory component SIN3
MIKMYDFKSIRNFIDDLDNNNKRIIENNKATFAEICFNMSDNNTLLIRDGVKLYNKLHLNQCLDMLKTSMAKQSQSREEVLMVASRCIQGILSCRDEKNLSVNYLSKAYAVEAVKYAKALIEEINNA